MTAGGGFVPIGVLFDAAAGWSLRLFFPVHSPRRQRRDGNGDEGSGQWPWTRDERCGGKRSVCNGGVVSDEDDGNGTRCSLMNNRCRSVSAGGFRRRKKEEVVSVRCASPQRKRQLLVRHRRTALLLLFLLKAQLPTTAVVVAVVVLDCRWWKERMKTTTATTATRKRGEASRRLRSAERLCPPQRLLRDQETMEVSG